MFLLKNKALFFLDIVWICSGVVIYLFKAKECCKRPEARVPVRCYCVLASFTLCSALYRVFMER